MTIYDFTAIILAEKELQGASWIGLLIRSTTMSARIISDIESHDFISMWVNLWHRDEPIEKVLEIYENLLKRVSVPDHIILEWQMEYDAWHEFMECQKPKELGEIKSRVISIINC